MTRTFDMIRPDRYALTFLLFACTFGCTNEQNHQQVVPTTQQLEVECSDLQLELTTTLSWTSNCSENALSLATDESLPPVTVQLLTEDATDPLATLFAMLKKQPGLHDVELHLTDVSICGAFTCLSYKASFQRLSRTIERLGVVAVGRTKSLEFTTSIDPTSPVAKLERHLALHGLHDLTHRLSSLSVPKALAL